MVDADDRAIVVVSGLPRSGTSMMMAMLKAGGVPLSADEQRTPDEDNPRGYFEDSRVRRLPRTTDVSWLKDVRGKAIKVVSSLLPYLPSTESFTVIRMRRDLDEVLASQRRMLERNLQKPQNVDAKLKVAFENELTRVDAWLSQATHIRCLEIAFATIVEDPHASSVRVAEFLSLPLDVAAMASEVDASLYRNRLR